jgi:hypothetical protein
LKRLDGVDVVGLLIRHYVDLVPALALQQESGQDSCAARGVPQDGLQIAPVEHAVSLVNGLKVRVRLEGVQAFHATETGSADVEEDTPVAMPPARRRRQQHAHPVDSLGSRPNIPQQDCVSFTARVLAKRDIRFEVALPKRPRAGYALVLCVHEYLGATLFRRRVEAREKK